jgi:aryl-alcohol dehydrogenase-like predicted oxidoreductase
MKPMAADPGFLFRTPPRLRKRVFRLGLSASYGLDEAGAREALASGMNYVFWAPSARKLTRALRDAVKADRERLVIATGPTLGYTRGAIRRRAERALKLLGTDYIDVLQLYWLGAMSAWTRGTVDELVKLKEEGKVRALGVSIHDRERAGALAADSPLDLLMIRYNAAHPGAERDIFPHLAVRVPAVVAYTATSWTKLLRRPRGWAGRVPTAGDCYRFCLTSPNVDVVLSAPGNAGKLRENLRALEQGPLSGEEMAYMREFGRVVHG